MEKKLLGDSDLSVTPICVGCWQFNDGEMSGDRTWNGQPYDCRHSTGTWHQLLWYSRSKKLIVVNFVYNTRTLYYFNCKTSSNTVAYPGEHCLYKLWRW